MKGAIERISDELSKLSPEDQVEVFGQVRIILLTRREEYLKTRKDEKEGLENHISRVIGGSSLIASGLPEANKQPI